MSKSRPVVGIDYSCGIKESVLDRKMTKQEFSQLKYLLREYVYIEQHLSMLISFFRMRTSKFPFYKQKNYINKISKSFFF